jgi:hypothetical protein
MPISTIPVKWLQTQSNQYTSRFIVENNSAGITKPERKLLHETVSNEPEALVAQPAERRFRNSSLIP